MGNRIGAAVKGAQCEQRDDGSGWMAERRSDFVIIL
jgi:hypothetical protein